MWSFLFNKFHDSYLTEESLFIEQRASDLRLKLVDSQRWEEVDVKSLCQTNSLDRQSRYHFLST